MEIKYTTEKNALILIRLLKEHNVKRIIISPGSTNICFAASVQQDDFFEVYSAVDERSAAYMACGLAAETKEPVVISCTGATASRNYMPALTEAYYRHLPIIAVTSTQPSERVGHNIPQVLDRSVIPNDIVNISVYLPLVINNETEWTCITRSNKALIEVKRNGGGPVHIDLVTAYTPEFTVNELPSIRVIKHIGTESIFPDINMKYEKIAIFVGTHTRWSQELTQYVEIFCEKYNAVVLSDHTGNYMGKYGILANILCIQNNYYADCRDIDLLIHLGEISASYLQINPKVVWRVHPDGEVKDTFKCMEYIFDMLETSFFKKYVLEKSNQCTKNLSYYKTWKAEIERINSKIPDLPFSNAWVAQHTASKLPSNSAIHFGILNSFRTWNYFNLTKGVEGYCNAGGFGIDGGVSALVGASLSNPQKLYFGVIGDLAFFYDMNVLGNRHIKSNIRLIVINNGKGNEFRNYGNWGAPFGEYADKFIAAAGHFGDKSPVLLKHYAEDLGFKYLYARNKSEYLNILPQFLDKHYRQSPILLEVFTETQDESDSLKIICNLEKTVSSIAKDIVKETLGKRGTDTLKKILRKK